MTLDLSVLQELPTPSLVLDADALRPYYEELVAEFLPPTLAW